MKLLAVSIQSSFFGSGASSFQNLTGIGSLTTLFLRASFVIAGLIMLFYFILGGIGMIAGAGKSDPKQMEMAKQSLTTGIIGFIIVIMAYWIVKLILNILNLNTLI